MTTITVIIIIMFQWSMVLFHPVLVSTQPRLALDLPPRLFHFFVGKLAMREVGAVHEAPVISLRVLNVWAVHVIRLPDP